MSESDQYLFTNALALVLVRLEAYRKNDAEAIRRIDSAETVDVGFLIAMWAAAFDVAFNLLGAMDERASDEHMASLWEQLHDYRND